jgi:hypothetical protein
MYKGNHGDLLGYKLMWLLCMIRTKEILFISNRMYVSKIVRVLPWAGYWFICDYNSVSLFVNHKNANMSCFRNIWTSLCNQKGANIVGTGEHEFMCIHASVAIVILSLILCFKSS